VTYDEDATGGWARALNRAEIPMPGPMEAAIKGARVNGAAHRLICPHCFGEGYLVMVPRLRGGEGEALEDVG
jgi:hypothetical protein